MIFTTSCCWEDLIIASSLLSYTDKNGTSLPVMKFRGPGVHSEIAEDQFWNPSSYSMIHAGYDFNVSTLKYRSHHCYADDSGEPEPNLTLYPRHGPPFLLTDCKLTISIECDMMTH